MLVNTYYVTSSASRSILNIISLLGGFDCAQPDILVKTLIIKLIKMTIILT